MNIKILESLEMKIEGELDSISKKELFQIAMWYKTENNKLMKQLRKKEREVEEVKQNSLMNYSIYKIYFKKEPASIYIGKARNHTKRFGSHKTDLRAGKHSNVGLVELCNKYGLNDMVIEVIDTVITSFDEAFEIERRWIEELSNTYQVLNMSHTDSSKGGRPPKFGQEYIQDAIDLLETHSYKELEELTGISKSTLIRAKRKQDFK